jgi:hypothetical protein
VLLRQLLLYARDRKLTEFDFTSGGEAYKDRFATGIRSNLTMYLNHDLGLRRHIQVSVQRLEGNGRQFLEALRKYPPAYRFVGSTIVSYLNWWRRERRLMWYQGTRYRANLVRRVFRDFIFYGRKTVIFSIPKQEVECHAGLPSDGLSVNCATLTELALIWAVHPDVKPPLHEFQARLVAGEQIFVVRQGSEAVQIWCATTQTDPLSRHKEPSDEGRRVLMLEQCWTAAWFHNGGFFRGILQQVRNRNMDVLVSCEENGQISREMHSVGFRVSHRAMHFRLLHWFRPVFVCRATSP